MLNTLRLVAVQHWVALSLLALFVLSVLSLVPLPAPTSVAGNDKLLHVVAWGLAVLPAAVALGLRVLPLAALFLAWSVAIEFLQPLVGRFFDVADMLANALGLGLGVALGCALQRPPRA